jgi:4-hydroxybenzoate polyprenyltransferase
MGLDTLRFLRVRDWFYFLALPLLSWDPSAPDLLRLVVAAAVAACCLAFAYGWNNIRDAGLDRSVAKNPLAGGGSRSGATNLFLLAGLAAAGLGGGAWLGVIPGSAAAIQLTGSALYSGGPRLKALPVVCTLANLWIFCPLAFLCQGPLPWTSGLWAFTGLFGLVLVQNQLLHEAMDCEEDASDGVRTTAALLGPSATAVLSAGLGLAAGAATVALGVSVGAPVVYGAAALPVTLFSLAVLLRPGAGTPGARRRLQRAVGMATCGLAWGLYVAAPLVTS